MMKCKNRNERYLMSIDFENEKFVKGKVQGQLMDKMMKEVSVSTIWRYKGRTATAPRFINRDCGVEA